MFTDKTPEYFLFSSDLRETNEIINHIQCIVACCAVGPQAYGQSSIQQSLDAGMDGYLYKPFVIEQLRRELEELDVERFIDKVDRGIVDGHA